MIVNEEKEFMIWRICQRKETRHGPVDCGNTEDEGGPFTKPHNRDHVRKM